MAPLRPTLCLLAVLTILAGCDGVRTDEDAGYAAQVQTDTDGLAADLLPALVAQVPLSVATMEAGFIECAVSGWRYEADGDFVGEAAAGDISPDVSEVMEEQGLTVERRADDSVVGRDDELSVLVGPPLGPSGRSFRHITITHACAGYSDADVSYAESSTGTDYAAYVG